jgi:hypothetical protein
VSVFGYDPLGKECLLFDRNSLAVWSYRTAEKKWNRISPKGPPPPKGRDIGYFDPARNVFVINSSSSVWVYRHKRAAK